MKWDERGLIPAVAQDVRDGSVLMVAWMNAEALEKTRETGMAHFWSRSRGKLWMKGETSGNVLAVEEIRIDCDEDTILLRVEAAGPACHTGKRTCFYRTIDGAEDEGARGCDAGVLDMLETVLQSRRDSDAGKSYTKSLLDAGAGKILAKIAEEHGELAAEIPEGPRDKVVHETADLIFHVMVGLVWRDIPVADVWRELERRFGTSGHVEKASRGK